MAHYIIMHWTKKSYLGKSGWTSSLSFARKFDSFAGVHSFCTDHDLHDQSVTIARVVDNGYGYEIEEPMD